MPRLLDVGENVARLILPGSKLFFLRPRGWGKSALINELEIFFSGGKHRLERHARKDSWIQKNRPSLLKHPGMPCVKLDFEVLPFSELSDIQTTLETQIKAANASAENVGKVAVLIDNYDAPFVQGAPESDLAKCADFLTYACDLQDRSEKIAYIFVAGTYLLNVEPLSRMKNVSMDLHHHDTVGVSDSKLRNLFSLGSLWRSHDRIAPNKSPKRRFGWDTQECNRIEKVSKANIELTQHESETIDPHLLHILNHGGYWWGGYDLEGRPELVSPLISLEMKNSVDVKPLPEVFGIPESEHLRSVVESCLVYRDQHVYASGLVYPIRRSRALTPLRMDTRCNLPSALLQHGLLTLGQRSVRFDEFHTYAYVRLCPPNDIQRAELLKYFVKTCFRFEEQQYAQIASLTGSLSIALRDGNCKESVISSILKEMDSLLSVLDASLRNTAKLLLILTTPYVYLRDLGDRYVDSGPVDTIVAPREALDLNSGGSPLVLTCRASDGSNAGVDIPDTHVMESKETAYNDREILLCDCQNRLHHVGLLEEVII